MYVFLSIILESVTNISDDSQRSKKEEEEEMINGSTCDQRIIELCGGFFGNEEEEEIVGFRPPKTTWSSMDVLRVATLDTYRTVRPFSYKSNCKYS